MARKKKSKVIAKSGGALMRSLGARRVEVWLSEDEYGTVEMAADLLGAKVAKFVREAALADAHKVQLRYSLDKKAAEGHATA